MEKKRRTEIAELGEFGLIDLLTKGFDPADASTLRAAGDDAAKEGLLDPNKTIGQVAYELGFQYPQHFVRFFKRHVGYTPREYRLQS